MHGADYPCLAAAFTEAGRKPSIQAYKVKDDKINNATGKKEALS
jgi:hypothetical protein